MMVLSMRVLIAVVALIWAFAGLGQSAYALGKHKAKKNTTTYSYLAPKKQKKPTGYYQSTLTGDMVYGKKKK
jgi:hypothetical protein